MALAEAEHLRSAAQEGRMIGRHDSGQGCCVVGHLALEVEWTPEWTMVPAYVRG